MPMPKNLKNRAIATGFAIVSALAVAACSSQAGAIPEVGATSDPETRFAACLTQAGLTTHIRDFGESNPVVFVLDTGWFDDAYATPFWFYPASNPNEIFVAFQNSDELMAFPEIHQAYATCETAHPEFTQGTTTVGLDLTDPYVMAQQTSNALRFARCARDEGFAFIADPNPQWGSIILPFEMTTDEAYLLGAACWHPEFRHGFGVEHDAFLGDLDSPAAIAAQCHVSALVDAIHLHNDPPPDNILYTSGGICD
jgi:hypothetical protein